MTDFTANSSKLFWWRDLRFINPVEKLVKVMESVIVMGFAVTFKITFSFSCQGLVGEGVNPQLASELSSKLFRSSMMGPVDIRKVVGQDEFMGIAQAVFGSTFKRVESGQSIVVIVMTTLRFSTLAIYPVDSLRVN